MNAEEILAALKKKGTITEADILEAQEPSKETKQLTGVLHLLLANEDQARVFHTESNSQNPWDEPAHRYWLRVTYKIAARLGGIDETIRAVEKTTRISKTLSKEEKTLFYIIERRETLSDWIGIPA